MAPESTTPQSPSDDTESYVGLPAEDAERRAYERGWTTVRQLEPDAIITMEFLVGRLNLAVKDGEVVRCWKG
ncbi:I78 family peptidase inhibitor [Streptomyces sp. NPDC048172]|uniref:I78 family peptidase inhibitor n=1 Tax=Streptomyces sp. NPDC048172 TaxID=3365505 RepID=UPI0037162E4A